MPPVPDHLPETSLLIRCSFAPGSEDAWVAVCRSAQEPVRDDPGQEHGVEALLTVVGDPAFDGVVPGDLVGWSGPDHVFLVDERTLTDPEHPILVVDLGAEPGRSFRTVPTQLWAVQTNLQLHNMEFADFADVADNGDDGHGVFRGFPDY